MVAAVLVAGSEKAAAHRLGLSHSTVKHHLANARSKVGATTIAQLVWILAPRLPEPEGLAVESADAAKAAAASAQAAVSGAAEAVDRAKEASDLASAAAGQASEAAQHVYAEAQEDVERTGEIAREANALEAEAGGAYRKAQNEAFERHRGQWPTGWGASAAGGTRWRGPDGRVVELDETRCLPGQPPAGSAAGPLRFFVAAATTIPAISRGAARALSLPVSVRYSLA